MPSRLQSSLTGTIIGTREIISFVHGLRWGHDPVTPDVVELEFNSPENTSGGAAPTPYSETIPTPAGVPAAGQTVTIGNATYNEIYTARVAAALPFEFSIGTGGSAVNNTIDNLVAEVNKRTVLNIFADRSAGFRIRSSCAPGKSTLHNGSRDWSSNATTWAGAAWGAPAAGAGVVSGAPDWSVIYRDEYVVKVEVRGMKATTTLAYTIKAAYANSLQRILVPVQTSGIDLAVNLAVSNVIATSPGADFIAAGVIPGEDTLVITDTTDPANNGVYEIAARTTTTLTVKSAKTFNKTIAAMVWSLNSAVLSTQMESGGPGQVPFDLPSPDQHYAGHSATDVDLPGAAVTAAELAFAPKEENGKLASFMAHFNTAAFPNGQTIQIAAGDVWTGVPGASDPTIRTFQSGGGIAADCASFIASVNGAGSVATAVALAGASANDAVVVAKTATQVLAPVSSHANCVVASSTALRAAVARYTSEGAYDLDAGVIDTGFLAAAGEIVLGSFQGNATAPRLKSFDVYTTAGAKKADATLVRTIRALAANRYAVCVADAGAVLAASDHIEWSAIW